MPAMFGWESDANSRASRSNRASRSGSVANSWGSILIATSRPSRESRARYTSPIPPAPSGATISYAPSLAPEVSGTRTIYNRCPECARRRALPKAFPDSCRYRPPIPAECIEIRAPPHRHRGRVLPSRSAHDAMLHGPQRGGRASGDADLVVDVLDMVIGGLGRDE